VYEREWVSPSSFYGTRWTLKILVLVDKPVIEYSRSAVCLAKHYLQHGGNNLELARQYVEKVAASNAEEVREATELLKQIKSAITAQEEARMTAQDMSMTNTGPAST
jgi:hypothetical protein